MAKLPSFQFYPGDWMKDPELRICSHFARGLLVDLLCTMFEAKCRGRLCYEDGTPWSDEEIVDSSTGGSREEKLAALRELERRGVLKRDGTGVLFSARILRDEEMRQQRAISGSKGGSKAQAKRKQTSEQSGEQKQRSSSSTSTSTSTSVGITPPKPPQEFDPANVVFPLTLRDPLFLASWLDFVSHRSEIKKPLKPTQVSKLLRQMEDMGVERAVIAMDHTVANGWQGLREPDGKVNGSSRVLNTGTQEFFRKQIERMNKNGRGSDAIIGSLFGSNGSASDWNGQEDGFSDD